MKLATSLVLAALLATATVAPAQTLPAIDLKNPQAVAALQKDLASDDFATRDRAQHLVDQIPITARDDLAKIAAAATDLEAKTRLRARLDLLDDIHALATPPISIDVKDAVLADLAAAFQKALDVPFGIQGRIRPSPDTWTLKADNLPFCEVYRRLYIQHPLMFTSQFDAIGIHYDANNWRQCSIFQGTALCIPDITPAGANGKATTQLSIIIDPRLPLRTFGPVEFAPATDNTGAIWTAIDSSPKSLTPSGRLAMAGRQINFQPVAPTDGTAIRSLRGAFPIVVQTAAESKDFYPDKDPLNKPFTLSNLQLTMTKCQTHTYGTTIDHAAFDLAIRVAPDKEKDPGPIGPVTVSIIDAKDKTLAVQTKPQGFTGVFSFDSSLNGTPPVTFRIAGSSATREVKIPFEFKNLLIQR